MCIRDSLYTGQPAAYEEPGRKDGLLVLREGLKTPSAVQYVARAGHVSHYTGAYRILKVILSYDYLWIQIRDVYKRQYQKRGDAADQ